MAIAWFAAPAFVLQESERPLASNAPEAQRYIFSLVKFASLGCLDVSARFKVAGFENLAPFTTCARRGLRNSDSRQCSDYFWGNTNDRFRRGLSIEESKCAWIYYSRRLVPGRSFAPPGERARNGQIGAKILF